MVKALILAAGNGSRLSPLTDNLPKTLLRINNETLLSRLCRQLEMVGVMEIVIVVGFQKSKIKKEIKKIQQKTNQNFIFIENEQWKWSNAYSFYLAKKELTKNDFITIESDLILGDNLLEKLIDKIKTNAHHPIAVGSLYTPAHNGSFLKDGRVKSFSDFKFKYLNRVLKTLNIYYLPKQASKKIFKNYDYLSNNYYELEFKNKFDVFNFESKWWEIDTPQDLSQARILFGSRSEKYQELSTKFGGLWRYPEIDNFILPTTNFLTEKINRILNEKVLLQNYPSPMDYLRTLASKSTGINPSNLLVGNGASEFIKILSSLKAEEDFDYHTPIFGEYKLFKHNPESKNKIIVNPNNPDGLKFSRSQIIEFLENGDWVILDESFIDFGGDTLLDNKLLNKYPGLIIIKSYSKHLGIPGLRLGMLFTSNQKLINQLLNKIPIWNINSVAEKFLEILPFLKKDIERNIKNIKKEGKIFKKNLEKYGKAKLVGNFIFFEPRYNSRELGEILLDEYDILVKDLTSANFNALRINVKDRDTNLKFIKSMEDIVGRLERSMEQ
jgi:histidinol-phosphate/aromatic aminotransferase/cobyric acid decarboxylase-like protein/choline kinase